MCGARTTLSEGDRCGGCTDGRGGTADAKTGPGRSHRWITASRCRFRQSLLMPNEPNDSPPSPRAIRLAIIANSHTPYRLHLHRRIARELADVKLWSVYTHENSGGADWKFEAPDE